MNKEHKGLDLAGIIIIYFVSSALILGMLVPLINWGWLEMHELFLLIIASSALILTILYHTNKIENYVFIGIIGILISLIGGIFILAGNSNNSKVSTNEENELLNLEYKLRQLDILLKKGVLTKEEYDIKRQSIINKY